MADPKSRIIRPNMPKVSVGRTARAEIGGTAVDYQPDPALAVTVDPIVLQDPNALLGLLAALINVQHATVRELLESRETVEGLVSELVDLREQVGKLAADANTVEMREPILPSTAVEKPVENPEAPEAGAGVG